MVQLVCDLLDEGNAAFREGDWTEAQDHFSEGVNVALYAQAEGLNVPAALLESLYVNRAAVHQNMVNLTPISICLCRTNWKIASHLDSLDLSTCDRDNLDVSEC